MSGLQQSSRPTPGCSSSERPYSMHDANVADLLQQPRAEPHLARPFRLALPPTYANRTVAPPLVLFFHGWGGDLSSGDWLARALNPRGYAVASLLGFDDAGKHATSWNGAGTSAAARTTTNHSRTCHDPTRQFRLCYSSSCGTCADTCSWTTCEDSVAQTARLLDDLSAPGGLCYDQRRVWAVGVSNGGVFLYELASSPLGKRFAGFLPIIGSPHRDHNVPPRVPAPFFGVWGRADTTIPPLANVAANGHPGDPDVALDTRWGGWYYATARATTRVWAKAGGCEVGGGSPESCTTAACKAAQAASAAVQCVAWRCRMPYSVVECIHPGGHDVPSWTADALHAFMRARDDFRAQIGSGEGQVDSGGQHSPALISPPLAGSAPRISAYAPGPITVASTPAALGRPPTPPPTLQLYAALASAVLALVALAIGRRRGCGRGWGGGPATARRPRHAKRVVDEKVELEAPADAAAAAAAAVAAAEPAEARPEWPHHASIVSHRFPSADRLADE